MMLRRFAGLVFGLILFHNLCVGAFDQEDVNLKLDWAALSKDFMQQSSEKKIDRVEIYHISTNAQFRMNVTSAFILVNYDFKFTINEPDGWPPMKDLVRIVNRFSPKHVPEVRDLRWAYVFYSDDGKPLMIVAIDKKSGKGVINGSCVEFDTAELERWSSRCFRTAIQRGAKSSRQ